MTFKTKNLNDCDVQMFTDRIKPNTLIGSSSESACGIGAIIILSFDEIDTLERLDDDHGGGLVATLKSGETYELFDFVIV